jgi:hypothetical protein
MVATGIISHHFNIENMDDAIAISRIFYDNGIDGKDLSES